MQLDLARRALEKAEASLVLANRLAFTEVMTRMHQHLGRISLSLVNLAKEEKEETDEQP